MKIKYVAEDGEQFDSPEECQAYEENYAWFLKIWNGYNDPNQNNKWKAGIVDKGDVCNGKYVLDKLKQYFDIQPKKPNGPLLNNGDNNEQAWANPLEGLQLLHKNAPTTG